jgi:hypothetical protein
VQADLVSCIRSSSRDEPRSGPRALEPESRAWARREELLGTECVAPGVCSDGGGTVQQEREWVILDHVRTGEAVRHGWEAELGAAVVKIESVCASASPVAERRVARVREELRRRTGRTETGSGSTRDRPE